MDRIVILDTETSSLDDSAQCIEVAAVLFDVLYACPVRSFASLIRASDNPAEPVNRIPGALVATAPKPEQVWPAVARMIGESQAIVAHGADFDRRFVPADVAGSVPWVCSLDDLAWPRATKPRMSLVALALAHDLGVANAHRALVDCDLLSRLFSRVAEMGVELEPFLERGLRPKARFVVADRAFDPARNELAKAAGFSWSPTDRTWGRRMAIEDAAALPFAVEQCQ